MQYPKINGEYMINKLEVSVIEPLHSRMLHFVATGDIDDDTLRYIKNIYPVVEYGGEFFVDKSRKDRDEKHFVHIKDLGLSHKHLLGVINEKLRCRH